MRGPALALLLLAGCGAAPPPEVADRFCTTRIERSAITLPPAAPGQIEALRAAGFSSDGLETAEAIGALDILQRLVRAERAPRPDVPLLLARQQLTQHVLLGLLDVQATLAAIDCAGERGAQLRATLVRMDSQSSRNLGLAGLVIGGATAAITGGLSLASLSNAGDIAGIIGGSLGSAVGGAQLYVGASGQLRAQANPLAELRNQPEHSTIFPATVWRYLTRRDAPGEPNVAEDILAEWRSAGLISDDGAADLLFAPEARVGVDDLDRRDAMYDLLEARIALMNRDLRLFLEEIVARPLTVPPQSRRARAP
ncbi:MAG: hypothetical protein WCP77_00025 [Roseococcus sp.]